MDFDARLEEIRRRHVSNSNTKTLTLKIDQNIDTGFNSHNFLSQLATILKNSTVDTLIIDMSKTSFIASNQFAVLGCIIDEFARSGKKVLLNADISPNLSCIIRRNGFGKLFSLPLLPDINNTVIPYKCFDVNSINEYEAYLTLSLFSRNDLPKMSDLVADNIRDYLLEIFKNVKDHTHSSKVYTCGQFFPKSSLLYFSIVDTGETIPYNVYEYHVKHSLPLPDSSLKWALEEGNTTLDDDGPRGIGLYLIKEFVNLNQGRFYIVSGSETYEINTSYGERYMRMDYTFPGTIVTIAFNLDDKTTYYMVDENIPAIHF